MLDVILLFREALLGALVIALGCSVLGVYVVLRRIVFVGAALAQLSSAGIALAIFLEALGVGWGWVTGHVVLAFLVTLAGVVFFALHGARYRVPPDAGLGMAYVVAGAAGVLLIAQAAGADVHDLFLQGNILGITRADALLLLMVVGTVLAVHALLYKEFLFVSFDPDMARTLGYRVTGWNLLLYLTLAIVIAVAMQSAGVLLVFNFLVLPAVTGLLLGRGMAGVFGWAIASGLLAAAAGFALSIPLDLPTGPAIVAVSGILALLAWLARLAWPALR
ncbi:MAG: metal ABC transporter permease [Gemmatimonadetes bacterium]|nr:metal ABC transporter permease [Gemmatimonadota bacterium]